MDEAKLKKLGIFLDGPPPAFTVYQLADCLMESMAANTVCCQGGVRVLVVRPDGKQETAVVRAIHADPDKNEIVLTIHHPPSN